MAHLHVARAFGFQLDSDQRLESIYAYSPVYRLSDPRGDWILKRTQRPLSRGRSVSTWAQALAARGIQIITPAAGFDDNPRAFNTGDTDEVWVVYPFIAGVPYTGETGQIAAAGRLLGQIHTVGSPEDFGLKRRETVVAVEAAEIAQDVENILTCVRRVFPDSAALAQTVLSERTRRYFEQALPAALAARLPLAVCSWDYKASNLIYPDGAPPVLVDADNAGYIPRLYDLAIAACLFHNEGAGPCRVFTPAEWSVFLGSYARQAQLTAEEVRAWEDVLLCAWVDEALWLLSNDDPGWADPRQSQLLLSLLLVDLSTLKLPG